MGIELKEDPWRLLLERLNTAPIFYGAKIVQMNNVFIFTISSEVNKCQQPSQKQYLKIKAIKQLK